MNKENAMIVAAPSSTNYFYQEQEDDQNYDGFDCVPCFESEKLKPQWANDIDLEQIYKFLQKIE